MNKEQLENINLEVLKQQQSEYIEDLEDDLEDEDVIQKGTNPLLWDKPTYAAVSFNSKGGDENPNLFWQNWAKEQNQS